jgi:diketogulonate reductase-like aldo/keto reductase
VRIIGVSNFSVEHLQQLVEDGASMLPAINQVEMHPYLQQRALRAFCAAKKIHVQGYSSMGRCDEPPRCLYGHYEPSHPKLVSDALVSAVAARNKLSPPQVLLLYSLQHGLSVIPKSQKTEHFDENFSAFAAGTFALCAADMALLDDIPRPAAEPFAYAYPLCKFPN